MSYLPDRGDAIWLVFDPQAGREQAGRRPAVVLTPSSYNRKTGLLLACPLTSHVKGYPFEVAIPAGLPVSGVVLSDHVRSADWRARKATFICRIPEEVVAEIAAKLVAIVPTTAGRG